MSNEEEPKDQPAADDQDTDSYYGEEDMAGDDLDLSFLDEEADEDEPGGKHAA